ncbi:hypothetical protein PMAYCL1PPCAC_12141, partial [Pristionchus mayeri]
HFLRFRMASFFRTFSSRFRKPRGNIDLERERSASAQRVPRIDPKKQVCCKVLLLDGTDLNVVVSKRSLAEEVYDQVMYSLDIEEREYFGLQFTDHYHVHHWLDPLKRLTKQIPIGPPFTLRLRVKFFTSEPKNLKEEITRYQFFLHLKQDVATGRLGCARKTAVDLAAFALQSELGDFNPEMHTPLFVSEFRFHPEQDETMEEEIVDRYSQCKGQSPAQAEMNYLQSAKWLEMYGVDMHVVEGKDGNHYSLGLTPQGMLVFDGSQKIGLFFWEKIQRLDFRSKKLTLVVEEEADQACGEVQLHTFVFSLVSAKACKHLWKCAVEQHSFFRLKVRSAPRQSRSQLFRLGSTFRYRGRTEYETVNKEGQRPRKSGSAFERRPSQRYGARESHLRKRDQRRADVRQQIVASLHAPPERRETALPEVAKTAAAERLERLISSSPPSVSSSSPPVPPPTLLPSHPPQSRMPVPTRLNIANPPIVNLPSEPRRIDSPSHVTTIPVGTMYSRIPTVSSPPSEKTIRMTVHTKPISPLHTDPSRLSQSRIPKYNTQSVLVSHLLSSLLLSEFSLPIGLVSLAGFSSVPLIFPSSLPLLGERVQSPQRMEIRPLPLLQLLLPSHQLLLLTLRSYSSLVFLLLQPRSPKWRKGRYLPVGFLKRMQGIAHSRLLHLDRRATRE